MITDACFSAAAISGWVTLGTVVAWVKACCWACAYSTDCVNCGVMMAPQASPG